MTNEWSDQNNAIVSTDETIVSNPEPRESAEPIGSDNIISSNISLPSVNNMALPNTTELGAPTRIWINQNITPALLEGMRYIAREKPEDPIKALGEFLIEYSKRK